MGSAIANEPRVVQYWIIPNFQPACPNATTYQLTDLTRSVQGRPRGPISGGYGIMNALLATKSSSSKLLKCLFVLVVALTHLILSQMNPRVLQLYWVNRSALWEQIIPVLGKPLGACQRCVALLGWGGRSC